MSAWHGTVLNMLDANYDGREEVTLPIMTASEQQRFAKVALAGIPGAHKVFNDVFGGKRTASDFPPKKLIDVGVPAFLWEGR
jgi:hypothetical protein